MGLVSGVGFSRTMVGSLWSRDQGKSGKFLQLQVGFDLPGATSGADCQGSQ